MKRSLTGLALALLLTGLSATLATGSGASAAQLGSRALNTPFRDDRSTAAAVLRSLYNAVNRREYARAYSYYAEAPRPYAQFVRGYADTLAVSLSLGPVQSEGAAGSVYSTVPVRLRALQRGGKEQVFVGCYVLRQIQPTLQEPPFEPIGITAGHLRRASVSAPRPERTLCAD